MKFFEKKNIVKIEEEDLKDAKLSSMDFKDEVTKKRAFIDVLGTRLAMKFLFSKKINANNIYSLYTIHNVLEEIDIADIYFEGIKLDIRLVFKREEIFIPKSHFENNLQPDLYLILELKEDMSSVEFLGVIEPNNINKTNDNKDFYFVNHESLTIPKSFKKFLKDFNSVRNIETSEEDIEKAQELFLSLADKEISYLNKLFLFQQLSKSLILREKMVEFENFEILSNITAKDPSTLPKEAVELVVSESIEDGAAVLTGVAAGIMDGEVDNIGTPFVEDTSREAGCFEAELNNNYTEDSKIDPSERIYENMPEEEVIDEQVDEIENIKIDKNNIVLVEEDDLQDAKSSLRKFVDNNSKKRAFMDVLGARLAMKLLSSKKINANNVYSLYTIRSILEEFDVADIYTDRIKFDTRLVFNHKEIFIPKSQFEHDLLPDLYLILELKEDMSSAALLGVIEPKDIDKTKENNDFYFVDYNQLTRPKAFKTFLKNFKSVREFEKSNENIEKAQELFLSLIDKEISEDDKYFLVQHLANSFDLREKMSGLENFEILSETAAKTETMSNDGVLDIVGAQQVFEEEEEKIVEKKEEPRDESLDEIPYLSLTDEQEQDGKDSFISGAAVGGVIGGIAGGLAAGAAISAASINGEIAPEAISSGIELGGELIKEGLNSIETNNDTNEIIEELPELESIEPLEVSDELLGSTDDLVEELPELDEIEPLEVSNELLDSANDLTDYSNDQKNEPEAEVFSLDDFDFSMLSDTAENHTEPIESEETNIELEIEPINELNEEELEIISEKTDSTEAAQIIEEPTPAVLENNTIEKTEEITQEDTEKDLLKVLFMKEGIKEKEQNKNPEEDKAEIETKTVSDIESKITTIVEKSMEMFTLDDRKMVIVASLACAVVATTIVGVNIHNNMVANQTTKAPAVAQVQTQNMNAPQNQEQPLGVDQAQTMPGETPQANQTKDMNQAVSDAFLTEPVNANISKVAWEVPEDLAYNDSFRQYLQMAGKNLKLNLQNDLLLANEMAYSNKIIINLNIAKDGSLISENIAVSSGSKQIDKIVLQSVKNTLRYLKMPSSELNSNSTPTSLIINF